MANNTLTVNESQQELLQEANMSCAKIGGIIQYLSELDADPVYKKILAITKELKSALVDIHTLKSGVLVDEPIIP